MAQRLLPIGVIAAFIAGAASTHAQTPGEAPIRAPAPETEQRPVIVYGDDHPDCLQWADGCFTCAKQPDGAAACSTAGAACLPVAVQCTKKAPDAERSHK